MTKKNGSFTLEDSLVQLVNGGNITVEDASVCAIHRDDFEILLKAGQKP